MHAAVNLLLHRAYCHRVILRPTASPYYRPRIATRATRCIPQFELRSLSRGGDFTRLCPSVSASPSPTLRPLFRLRSGLPSHPQCPTKCTSKCTTPNGCINICLWKAVRIGFVDDSEAPVDGISPFPRSLCLQPTRIHPPASHPCAAIAKHICGGSSQPSPNQ